MYFSDICAKCTNQTRVEEYCSSCAALGKRACENWKKINETIDVLLLYYRNIKYPKERKAFQEYMKNALKL